MNLLRHPDDFRPAPPAPPLIDSALHIWRATLSGSLADLQQYTALLSPDERERAERFYFERDHDRYIFGRGILRTLLGAYLEMEPAEIRFEYGPYGKPTLARPGQGRGLQFNLAHSNDRAVYIFGWDRVVGIDVEHIRPFESADEIAKSFFTERESAWVSSQRDERRWDMFFKLWTCKEAYLKANGSGLTIPLNEVEIELAKDGAAQLKAGEDNIPWRLSIFTPFTGYQGAVVTAGLDGEFSLYHYAR